MNIPEGFTREELLACLDRELAYRQRGPAATAAREARSEVEALRARVAELEAEVTRLRALAATMTGVAP